MFKLNKEKCIKCKKCLRVCPFTVLKEIDEYPEIDESKFCLKCYHCAAICPTNSISFEDNTVKSYNECNVDLLPERLSDCNELLTELVKTRRSIRKYKNTPVEKDIIETVLETVKMIPTAKNQMKYKWIVVYGKEKVSKLYDMAVDFITESGASPEILAEKANGNDVVTLNAPATLFVYSTTKSIAPEIDCMIALTTAELLLSSKGIGTCHAGYLRRISNGSPQIRDFLGLAPEDQIFGAMTFGYADDEDYKNIPKRKSPEIKWL